MIAAMRVAVTGASGLIGSALVDVLRRLYGEAIPVVRRPPGLGELYWQPKEGMIDSLDGIDAVVHLAGAGLGDQRWTDDYKRELVESRTEGTRLVAEAVAKSPDTKILLSSSAIGYYGAHNGDEILTESSPPGDDFLAELCVDWEAATQPAIDAGKRVVKLRTGLVMTPEGGILDRLLLPFKLGLGGPLGSGKSWWSWITLADEIGAICHLLTTDVEGPVNLVAPNPVTNKEFTKALGKALRRPTIIPVPPVALALWQGSEMVDVTVMASQRCSAAKLSDSGYEFDHEHIDKALVSLVHE